MHVATYNCWISLKWNIRNKNQLDDLTPKMVSFIPHIVCELCLKIFHKSPTLNFTCGLIQGRSHTIIVTFVNARTADPLCISLEDPQRKTLINAVTRVATSTTSGNLKVHQLVHTKERKFPCPTCEYKAGTKSTLDSEDENPWGCQAKSVVPFVPSVPTT